MNLCDTIYTKTMKSIISLVLCFAALLGCSPAPESGMDIYTFSIGKADCSLLSFDGFNVLIDTGEEDDDDDRESSVCRGVFLFAYGKVSRSL